MSTLRKDILRDIKEVFEKLGRPAALTRGQYLKTGKFSIYRIYDGGCSWEHYCAALGIKSGQKKYVPDEVYFHRLQTAVERLGRAPMTSERKMFNLNFSKGRWPTLKAFVEDAATKRAGALPPPTAPVPAMPSAQGTQRPTPQASSASEEFGWRVPPIPQRSRRSAWEQTGVCGFPYAPHDELGVVALFAILCSRGEIRWDILEMRGGRGVDATCWDQDRRCEVAVELKYRLSKSAWNHPRDHIDYVVCWENRWPTYEREVLVLRDLIAGLESKAERSTAP